MAMIYNLFIRLLIVLAFMVHQGCTHTGPILSESVQENIINNIIYEIRT
jgi:hypothetical protein